MTFLGAVLAGGLVAELVKVGIPLRPNVRTLLEKVGAELGVEPDILNAIAWQEGGLNPAAPRGAAGEIGMMQVRPGTVPGRPNGLAFTAAELSTPEGNIRAAARLWVAHVKLIGPSVVDGFSAYNAGLAGTPPSRLKKTAAGGYINERYVFDATAKYAALKVATLAPSNLIRRV